MNRIIFYYAVVVALMDSLLLSIYSSFFYIVIAFFIIAFVLIKKIFVVHPETLETDDFFVGEGVDITNPDKPTKRDVKLNLMLGFMSIGGQGSGKSMFSVLVLRYFTVVKKVGWIFWDGKGDFDVYQKVIASGARPDKFFSVELPSTDTVNIVSGSDKDTIEAITQALITTENEFYKTAQREAVGAIVRLLKSTGKRVNLQDIFAAIKVDQAAFYALELAKENNAPYEVIAMAEQYLGKDQKTRAQEVSGLLTKMSLFVTGDTSARLNAYFPSLDLVDSSAKGERVYMHMPYSAIAKDVSIFLTEIIGSIARSRQLKKGARTPWPMVFDDWGKFFYANVGAITNRCRSALMPFSYLFQSIGQLDAVDPHFRVELADSVADKYFFRLNGPETAAWASKQFGDYERRNINANGDLIIEDRPRVKPEALGDLDAGRACMRYLEKGLNGANSIRMVEIQTPYEVWGNESSIEWPVADKADTSIDETCLGLWDSFVEGDKLKFIKDKLKAEAELKKTDMINNQRQFPI